MSDPLHRRLRASLDARRMTQEALARSVGVSTRTVGRWVSGADEPRGQHYAALIEALPELAPATLLGRIREVERQLRDLTARMDRQLPDQH